MVKEFQVYKLKIEDGNGYMYCNKVYDLVNEVARDSIIILCYNEITDLLSTNTLIGLARIESRTKEFSWQERYKISKIQEEIKQEEQGEVKEISKSVFYSELFNKGLKEFISKYFEINPRDRSIPIIVSDESNLEKCLEVLIEERIDYEVMNK